MSAHSYPLAVQLSCIWLNWHDFLTTGGFRHAIPTSFIRIWPDRMAIDRCVAAMLDSELAIEYTSEVFLGRLRSGEDALKSPRSQQRGLFFSSSPI